MTIYIYCQLSNVALHFSKNNVCLYVCHLSQIHWILKIDGAVLLHTPPTVADTQGAQTLLL